MENRALVSADEGWRRVITSPSYPACYTSPQTASHGPPVSAPRDGITAHSLLLSPGRVKEPFSTHFRNQHSRSLWEVFRIIIHENVCLPSCLFRRHVLHECCGCLSESSPTLSFSPEQRDGRVRDEKKLCGHCIVWIRMDLCLPPESKMRETQGEMKHVHSDWGHVCRYNTSQVWCCRAGCFQLLFSA